MTDLYALRTAIDTALTTTLRMTPRRSRTRAATAVMAAVNPHLTDAVATVTAAHEDTVARQVRAATFAARADALEEAAAMLARNGHKSAVTRVRDLAATPEVTV